MKIDRKERRNLWKLIWKENKRSIEGDTRLEKRQNWYTMWRDFK